ncbi:hypothetical protein [Spirosoma sp. 48-14]|uniref:hypothetical protein n=1 Tax=Spirosoma sp. 48-14 TaxID=1895854 RepID=UPI0009606F6E|nr:hypothetical protein [Spirosoma sp. 48-14]OJW76868.1 MAG: hypothetical protein BGO59_21810 [Spirosoma sp. 48-14]
MNKLIVIRGTSPTGNVVRMYLNVDEHEALQQFLKQFIYVSSDIIEFDHELQVDTPEPYLRFKAVTDSGSTQSKPINTNTPIVRLPWQ